jgi:hypothetical protein
MHIIQIEQLENGAHNNQNSSVVFPCPDGWAIIPDDMTLPDSFPFVDIEVVDGVVTSMTAREVPPAPPTPEDDSDTEILNALLGVTEDE